jgi:hypothetical protein
MLLVYQKPFLNQCLAKAAFATIGRDGLFVPALLATTTREPQYAPRRAPDEFGTRPPELCAVNSRQRRATPTPVDRTNLGTSTVARLAGGPKYR